MTIVVDPNASSSGGTYTFLALTQRLRRRCRVSGTGPTDVVNQNEEYSRLIDWINEAYMLILRMRTDWRFMRSSASAVTVQGQPTYSPTVDFALTDFGYWALDYASGDSFRNYDTAAGIRSEIFMAPMRDYDAWRDTYLYGALRSSYSRPVEVALAPDNSIACGPIPLAGYTLIGDYYRVPTEMVLKTDVPVIPDQFRMAIVYQAMMLYGLSEAAPEVYDDGEQQFNRVIRQLITSYAKQIQVGGSLC